MSTVINKIFNGRKKEGGLEPDGEEVNPAICDAILNAPMVPPIVNYSIGIHEAAFMDLPDVIYVNLIITEYFIIFNNILVLPPLFNNLFEYAESKWLDSIDVCCTEWMCYGLRNVALLWRPYSQP